MQEFCFVLPQFGSAVNTDFILGMGKIGETVKILLDINKVLAGDDFTSFADTAKQDANTGKQSSKKETENEKGTENE